MVPLQAVRTRTRTLVLVKGDRMDSENLLIASTIMRAPSFDDAEAVADLFNASSLDVSGEREIDVNELRREWQTPGFDLARDARVVLTPEGQIIGYGELWDVRSEERRVGKECGCGWGRENQRRERQITVVQAAG